MHSRGRCDALSVLAESRPLSRRARERRTGRGLVDSAFGRNRRSQRPGRLGPIVRGAGRAAQDRRRRMARHRAAARRPFQSLSAHLSQRGRGARRRVSQSGSQLQRWRLLLPRQSRGRHGPLLSKRAGRHRNTPGSDSGSLARSSEDLLEGPRQGDRADASRARASCRILPASEGRAEVRLSQTARERRWLEHCERSRSRLGRSGARAPRAAAHRCRPLRPRRATDSFTARRTARQAGAGGILLRAFARDAARHALGRQDVLIDHARLGDAARREGLARDADLRAARRARPVRESRPPQGADHARAPDDPQLGSGLRRLQPRLARQ